MDDDQQFCLRWNNHQSTLVAVFDTLLENEKLVDCTLAAEGKFLQAHKVVLSACSPYFESLLSRHYDKHPILILKDVKFQELKAMMDYMYRGEVNISQDQLGALLKAAESLQIKGLSDNKKEEPAKRAAPVSSAPKSPPPQLPKVQGLTIEQRSRVDDREGSISPTPRKKKRMRRKSEDLDNHHDASNSSDAHSLPQNIPSATSLPVNVKMNSDVPETIETKHEIMLRHKDDNGSQQSQVPMIKEKIETHTELMLEPKSEYVDEMNEDSIEDLTLDDDDLSNMEQMDEGAGPSHGGEGSSQQGFGHWQMGNQSQDEVFLAAQEAVGAHRDSQGYMRRQNYIRAKLYSIPNTERRDHPPPSYNTPYKSVEVPGARREQVSQVNVQPTKLPENTLKSQPQQMKSLQAKPSSQQQRNLQTKFPSREAEQSQEKLSQVYIQQQAKAAQKSFRPIKPIVRKVELLSNPQQPEDVPPQKPLSKPSSEKDPGLLTDSLSCIFTRRVNQQRKLSQNRSLIENLPQISVSEVPKEKQEEMPHYESIAYCPNPPRISQPTPNISTEDWFTTKQRILGNVKPDSAQFITEPMKIPDPAPPRAQVDPEGFDIEPPVPMNHNVSPYIPSDNFERDEYERYKKDKLKNEITYALLQKHYGQVKVSKKLCQEDKSRTAHSDNQPSERYHQDAELKEEYPVEKDQYDSQEYQYQYEPAQNTQYTNDSQRYQEQSDQYCEHYDTYMDQAAQEENYDGNNLACPEAPNISSVPQQDHAEHVPPEAPKIYHEETQYYQDYAKYDETNTFKEPLAIQPKSINKTMCHKCSFQTTDLKKLRAHLKFVHGEVVADSTNQSPKNELFSRREAKAAKDELFSRRENFAGTHQQQVEKKGNFRRRNKVVPNVNVISSEVVVEAKGEEPGGNETTEAEN